MNPNGTISFDVRCSATLTEPERRKFREWFQTKTREWITEGDHRLLADLPNGRNKQVPGNAKDMMIYFHKEVVKFLSKTKLKDFNCIEEGGFDRYCIDENGNVFCYHDFLFQNKADRWTEAVKIDGAVGNFILVMCGPTNVNTPAGNDDSEARGLEESILVEPSVRSG